MSSEGTPEKLMPVPPKTFRFKSKKPSRRHTLVLPRGILKPSKEENHTIAIIPKSKTKSRRVSFASDVDVRNIIHRSYDDFDLGAKFNPRRKRDSIQLIPSFNQNRQIASPSLKNATFPESQSSSFREIPEEAEEEDDETDFSQPISKVRISIDETPSLPFEPESLSLEKVFERVSQLAEDDDDNSTMELTAPFKRMSTEDQSPQKQLNSITIEPQVGQSKIETISTSEEDGETMEFTLIYKQVVEENEQQEQQEMEFTQPVKPHQEEEMKFTQPVQSQLEEEMEFTQPVRPQQEQEEMEFAQSLQPQYTNINDSNDLQDESTTMELTEPIMKPTLAIETLEDEQLPDDDDMEFTQPIKRQQPQSTTSEEVDKIAKVKMDHDFDNKEETMELTAKIASISSGFGTPSRTIENKISTPSSSGTKRKRTDLNGSPQSVSKIARKLDISPSKSKNISQSLGSLATETSPKHPIEQESNVVKSIDVIGEIPTTETRPYDTQLDTEEHESLMNSSYADESVIISEKIPLAEVTMDSVEVDAEYSSEEEYPQIPVSEFLESIQVTFYDNLGPSEREISFPTVESSKPVKMDSVEYAVAFSHLPDYFHYSHLTSEYKRSLEDKRASIEEHERAIFEGNLSVKEYFEADEIQLKPKLNDSYQGLASYARQLATQENLEFMITTTNQVKENYELDKTKLQGLIEDTSVSSSMISSEYESLSKTKLKLKNRLSSLEHQQKKLDSEDRAQLEQLKTKLLSMIEEKKRLTDLKSSTEKTIQDLKLKIRDQNSTNRSISKEVDELTKEIYSNKIPSKADLMKLSTDFIKLQKQTNLKLISLTNSELTVKTSKLVTIKINFEASSKTLEFINGNSSTANKLILSRLSEIFQDQLKRINESPVKQYLNAIINNCESFKKVSRDLKLLTHYHMFEESVTDSDDVAFSVVKSDKYKLSISFKLSDLLNFTNDSIQVFVNLIAFDKENYDKFVLFEEFKKVRSNKVGFVKKFVISA